MIPFPVEEVLCFLATGSSPSSNANALAACSLAETDFDAFGVFSASLAALGVLVGFADLADATSFL